MTLLAGVCRLSSSSVTLSAGRQAGRRARGRSRGRHCTAGQYGYVPLGWHPVIIIFKAHQHKAAGVKTKQGVYNGNHRCSFRRQCWGRKPHSHIEGQWTGTGRDMLSPLGLQWLRVMRRPSSCTCATALLFHVPDVSMAIGQKMCVQVTLAYSDIFCCAAWSAAAPGVMLVLAMCDSAYESGMVTSHASDLPRAIKALVVFLHQTDRLLDGWNVCPFDCSPDDVIKVAVTLLSISTSVAWQSM